MAWKKPQFSLTEVSQTINLKDLLGREPSESEAKLFVDSALQVILERTQSGKPLGGHGSRFKPYSESYAKAKGVSQNDVDLTRFNNMLPAMDGELINDEEVLLFVDDEDEVLKSYNHNVGDTLPKRTYFGLTQAEAKNIASIIKKPEEETKKEKKQRTKTAKTVGQLLGDKLEEPRNKNKTVAELLDEIGGLKAE